MYRVSDEQIEFILDDIKKRGIEMEDLQLNLLDHICCILERELKETDDFNEKYNETIKQFFKSELWEIEEETVGLLYFKNYYKMKRFLYILLVLSLGYNVLVLSKFGYNYYKNWQYNKEWEMMKSVTLDEGFKVLTEQLKEKNPSALEKSYLCISFVGDPMSEYERKYTPEPRDSSEIKQNKEYRLGKLRQLDSIAGIYNKNTVHIFAFKRSDEYVDQTIIEYKSLFKNVLFVDGQTKLLSGFLNSKKAPQGFSQGYFVLDKTGKVVFDCKHIVNQHIFLSRFLQTLPN
ncbi:MAG: hypothetical protein J0L69_02520 [Bacteroidetes bacterium]|nr:hypothetical protein [Bacteroidota bacterium]